MPETIVVVFFMIAIAMIMFVFTRRLSRPKPKKHKQPSDKVLAKQKLVQDMFKNPLPPSQSPKGSIGDISAKLGYDVREDLIANERKKKAEKSRNNDADTSDPTQ